MKLIGILLTWNNLIFLRYSLHQALLFCDEVIVVEGCHSMHYERKSTDGTREYLESVKNDKLKIFYADKLNYKGRYDIVQCKIRQFALNQSIFNKPGNWIIPWDDDVFYFNNGLLKIREIMETTSYDVLSFDMRVFFYNFQFNRILKSCGLSFCRITDKCYYVPISHLYYKNGKQYTHHQYLGDINCFHYSYMKLPERMKSRWDMSVEKGTKDSVGRFEKWMSFKWSNGEDFLKSSLVEDITGKRGKVGIYYDTHELLESHPWRYIEDVRKI